MLKKTHNRKPGRPASYKAKIYIGRKTTQLWLGKGVLKALGMPDRVKIEYEKTVDGEIILLVSEANEQNGLSVSSGGYVSGERLWTSLTKEVPRKQISCVYKLQKLNTDKGTYFNSRFGKLLLFPERL